MDGRLAAQRRRLHRTQDGSGPPGQQAGQDRQGMGKKIRAPEFQPGRLVAAATNPVTFRVTRLRPYAAPLLGFLLDNFDETFGRKSFKHSAPP